MAKKSGATKRKRMSITRRSAVPNEEDGTQMERDVRTKRRASTRRGENTEMLKQMRAFCLAAVQVGVPGLLKEFMAIKAGSTPAAQLSKTAFDKNTDKNRYKDVFCVDETRVILTWPPGSNDYIHANWVDVANEKKRFICTQAPKDTTVDDFWRMVWQESSQTIIMLCNIIECGKQKCAQYWPAEKGKTAKYGALSVTCKEVTQEEKMLTISMLTVTDGKTMHNVEHIAWNDWPDRGVPYNFLAGFRLLQRIKNQKHVIIHCSAGIGRTGTIVVLDVADHLFNMGSSVQLPDIVKDLRRQRHGSVQTDIQYVYIHRCIIQLSENKKVIKRDEIASFLRDFDILAKARGGPTR